MPAPHPQPKRARCVVWHPANNPPRPELAAALNRPAFRVFKSADPFHAMATLCSWSPDRRRVQDEGTILLLVEPEELPDLPAFLAARDHYAADAAVWVYERGSTPVMRVAREADLQGWKSSPRSLTREDSPSGPQAAASAPALRLSGEGVLPPEHAAEFAEPDTPSPVPDVKPRAPIPSAKSGPVTSESAASPAPSARPAVSSLLTDDELAMLLALEPTNRTK